MGDLTIKEVVVSTAQVLFGLSIIFGIIAIIVVLSNVGREQLQYVTVTPYERHITVVATFKKGECIPFYNNLKDNTNYRCIPSLTAVKEELLGVKK